MERLSGANSQLVAMRGTWTRSASNSLKVSRISAMTIPLSAERLIRGFKPSGSPARAMTAIPPGTGVMLSAGFS